MHMPTSQAEFHFENVLRQKPTQIFAVNLAEMSNRLFPSV